MKNMLRRNLALLLAVVMILSCAPLDGMAAVIGASQLFDQFADQLATDYSGGASIARIVQPPAAVDTYVFKVDDETIATQKVKKGDVLYEPAAPSKDGYKFTGWRDAAGSAPVFALVEAEATGKTYTYTAQFDQVYYVFFMDDQGRVQITREGTAGDAISTQVTIKLQNAQAAVTGWYYDAALTQPVQQGHVTLSGANITLWPMVEEGYYLTFETNGGTYYPPAFYMPGKPTVDPGVPQKAGYSFTGWKDETGASFAFGSALTADKTLTAQWQANQNTQYTVIHWMENANDDGYSFKESEEKTGTTGYPTAAAARNYTGFTAQTITQTAIAADGSTIVSVYYKRNVYDVKFYSTSGWDSSPKEYTDLRITAKYGASIGDKWPTYNGSNTWSTKKNGSGPYQVNIDTMPLNGANFYGPKTGSSSETAYYYVEVLPGETGTDVGGKSYKLHHSDTSPGTGYTVTVEDQYPITGYTFNASVSTKTGGRYNNAKFYYTRNSYDIIYMNGGSEVTSYRTSVLFEQTIPGAANKPAPTPPMGKENYTFEGWYDDPAGQALHKFSGEMPAQNITVYAKWAPPTVSGTAYITMAGNGSAPITIAYGGTINPDDLPTPTAPEGDGWEFVAWATKAGDVYTPFNFDTKIYENIELYPYYVNKNQYQVTYSPGEGTGTVEDTRRYASGAEADVKSAAGLTAPAGKVFVGWKVGSTVEIKQPGDKLTITGNMTLTAQWGDAPAAVTLTYYGNGGKTADGQTSTSVTHENNATISTLGSTAFTRRGYTLTGWNTQANGQGDPFNCDVPVLIDSHGDNALYAVWALDAGETVTVTYASEDAQKGTVSHTGDTIQIVSGDPVTGSTAAANPGYTFVGWYKGEARISSEAALTAATAKASLNKDADGLYADTTYIARFTERTDLSYTVHYYWNGTATPVAESKTVDGQTYGASSAPESPKPVDGCTPVSTASQTITIGAETNKIIFYYYKNVELTAKGDNVTYDGKEHTVSGFTGAPEAADFSAIQVGATGTNADTYPAVFPEDAVGTVDATRKYIVTKAKDGALVINPIADKVTVTVTEKSDTVTYDGTEHTVTGYESITADNTLYNVKASVKETPTAAWTATGTDAGEYPVGIEAKDFKNISQNFTNVEFEIVDGSLIINPITEKTITITAASEEKAYDGTALTNGGYTYTQGVLVNGDVLTATVEGSQTDAGSSANRVTGYKVMHGETDVTKNYTFAQSEDGTLTVKPVAIELTANSAEKIYDGTPLTDNGYQITKGAFVGEEGLASVTVEGSQTLVGTSANEIRAHGLKANTKAQNYAITYQPGQLTVKDRNEKYRLTVEANSGSKVYDGTALKVEGLKQLIFTVNEQTFTVSGLTAEKTATNVSESGAVAVRGTAIVKDAAGNDVTAQFDVQTVPGTLTISQRPVTITAENNTVEYTGKPHGANPAKPYTVEAAAENSGLAGGHQESNVNIAFTAINVGTYVGALEIAKNDVVILADGANVTANYTISVLPGTLEITGDKIAPNKTTPQQVESNYKLGDTIPFTITVKNVSTAIVENIIVEDPNAILVAGQGYSVSEDGHTATILSLAPDAQVEIQAQHVVTEADILAGTVGNTATVAWENTTRTVEAGTEEIEEPNGALGVTKETTSTPKNGKTYALGETITYKITVTNTGNLTAKNIQVTDSLSAKEGQVIATIDSLAPGASQEIPFAYVVTEQDILNGKVVNEAAAKGETDDPDKKPEGGDEKEDETDDVDATLEVVKTSNKQEGQKAKLGETIEYTITVTNKGNVAYRNVKVDDELTGLHETIDELGVGASESFTTTYTVTEEDILKGHVLNEATAAADPIHNPKTGEDEIPKGSDEVTDETVAAEGALGVTKETTSTPKNGKTYALGETITYKITVTNTGNLTAKNIQVTDSLSAKEGQVIATIDSLAPGASQEIPFAYVVTEQDILNGKVVNEAAAKGETDDPDKKPEGGDEKEDETDDVDATLEVVKTSNKQEGQKAKLGETIEYTITVTNKGNVTFRNVKVDDELTGLHETIDELGVGASESFTTTYIVTEEDILKGHVRNVATAEGDKVPDPKNPDDPKKPAGEDEQDDPTDEPDASLTVVKSLTNRPNKGYFTLGETAEFDVVVTNTGNVTLKNIRLTEMLDGAEFVTGEGYTVKNGQAVIEELKPGQEDGDGQSVTVKATYTIQTKDLGMGVLKNIVAGEGEGPGKNPDDEGGTEFDVDYAKQVNAVKVWEDEENKHETRPAAITFVLMDESTGEELDRKDATAANEWSVSFDNLPAHDADGKEIIYVLKEIEVTGYDTRYGGPVEPTVAPPVIQGAPETDKGGEQIPGDAEQDEPVERDVYKIDQTIINTLRSHKLTIRYWVEVVGGQKAFDTYEKEYYYNEQYSVVSPGMYGYEPDLPRVQGRMPDEDLEIDVVYVRQIYKLTIYYIFEDGTTAHKEYEAKLYADEKFEVESPEINGYKPNLWMISGVMPDRNLNYTVIYIARTKPVEIQEAVAPLGVGSVVPNTGDCFD